jgi:hypothetical protein
LRDYAALFEKAGTKVIRGESSTTYMAFPHVVERIAEADISPRFIFIVRNPIDRVESHYRWLKSLGCESRSLREAVEADAYDVPDYRNDIKGNYRYYASQSRYGEHVARYVAAFGLDRLLLLTTEELRSNPAATLVKCTDFLGIQRFSEVNPVFENVTVPRRLGTLNAFVSGRQLRSARLRRARRRLSRALRPVMKRPTVRETRRILEDSLDRVTRVRSRSGVMSEADRLWLRQLFSDDIARLRSVVERGFTEWAEDFP